MILILFLSDVKIFVLLINLVSLYQGVKTCARWAIGRAQIPASDALTFKVIPIRIPGDNIGVVVTVALFLIVLRTGVNATLCNCSVPW